MKAPSPDASLEDGAEQSELDYSDFFSVLMYYCHMSKQEILNSSRPFLYELYKKYPQRACENLGVSPNDTDEDENNNFVLKESDYPADLMPVTTKDMRDSIEKLKENEEMMKQFPELNFGVYKK